MSQEKVDTFIALRNAKAALELEVRELNGTRLPALQSAIDTAKFNVQHEQQTLNQSYNEEDFISAQESLENKKTEQRNNELMMRNVEQRIRLLKSSLIPEASRILESAHREMWEKKYDEVFATLPPLSDETLLIVEKLDGVLRNIDSHRYRLGIGYGDPFTKKIGKPSQQKIEEANALLRDEMGI